MIFMKKYISVLKETKLFAGVSEEDISAMLNCLQAKLQTYKKGEYILRQGEYVNHIAVLLEGSLMIQKEDFWGNRSITSRIGTGELFGEAYAGSQNCASLNDVIAVKDSAVCFFDVQKILTVCSSACKFHTLVIQNLFFAISEKNRILVQKLGHMSQRSTREKLISYLSEQANKHGSNTFSIPFNRQQLADFLSVDRSAMSKELCNMRDDGLLRFHKNQFTLL